jgi:hypothetical protein
VPNNGPTASKRTLTNGATSSHSQRFPANCHTAYRKASRTAKRQLNNAIFSRIALRDRHIDRWELHPPFDALFNPPRFEYGSKVEVMPLHTNTALVVTGPKLAVHRSTSTS